MSKIICFGEIMVDFIARGRSCSLADSLTFEKFSGGAPANTASALGRLDADVAMLGSVGKDHFGEFLKKNLARFRVEATGIQVLKSRPTAVVFASLDSQKIPQFHSFGEGVAYNYFNTNKKVLESITKSKIFHFTSIPLIQERYRKETIKALKRAREANVIISFDPNIRLHLFNSNKIARKLIKDVLSFSQIMKFGKDEFQFLFGNGRAGKVCERLAKQGAKLILITDGERGSEFYFKGCRKKIDSFKIKMVRDTIGAGDAYIAGILSKVVSFKNIDEISVKEMKEIASFATAVAAISITKKGATTALPTEKQVKRFLVSSQ